MCYLQRTCEVLVIILAIFSHMQECNNTKVSRKIDKKYHLTTEAYKVAKTLFTQGRASYDSVKVKSLDTIDTFLDLAYIMNNEMAQELRSAVVKFYKIKMFHDFTNYVITMDEVIDIIEHCLVEPIEKLAHIRTQFHDVIRNFEDVRNFAAVEKCRAELPDEVAAAHCILHQAVLFNETMQESLVPIVEVKTRQHAQDMNTSIFNVQQCLKDFVPQFFDQLMVEAYTNQCGYLKVVNASIADLVKDKWKAQETEHFPKKWSPLVKALKERLKPPKTTLQEVQFLSLVAGNVTGVNILQSFNS